MGAAEEQTPPKPTKSSSPAQETPTTMPPYAAEWSRSMQAYYNAAAAAPFYASTVQSQAPHPYIWPGQHPMMPPYGTPIHYPALYPPGGVYAHPNIGTIANTSSAVQAEGKNADVKDQSSAKKSRGNSGAGNEKAIETGKATSGSGNDGASQSGESGSEDSSNTSDDNHNQSSASKKGSFDLMLEDGANAHNNVSNVGPVPGNPVPTPATNLNIGMDLWNDSAPGAVKLRPSTGLSSAVVPSMVMGEIYDERELKKQKRKQSNRESARRSRLRKQAECEELQRKVECLNSENSALKDELRNLAEECMKLTAENQTIQAELKRVGKNDG
ncbi:hypothetical protein RND81_11G198300 [Saponaria officinalis]|uniref:BZIP domain-containing protein n=1 Tax=Saponaria officinalis TaxID=3572 RepID=A0AAW1HP50_SAPOF